MQSFKELLFLQCLISWAFFGVELGSPLGEGMVLQRDKPVHIWGTADPGKQIEVRLNSSSTTATADRNAKWDVVLPPQIAGGSTSFVGP